MLGATALLSRSPLVFLRHFRSSPVFFIKEVIYSKEGDVTVVRGHIKDSDRKPYLVNLDGFGDPRNKDPVERFGLSLKHTDVLILSQFLRPDATIVPRIVSGVSLRTQLHIELMIERAKNAGLIPLEIKADGSHIYKDNGKHRFNVYYDSDVIGIPSFKKRKPRYLPPE